VIDVKGERRLLRLAKRLVLIVAACYPPPMKLSNRTTLCFSLLALVLIELTVCYQYRGPAVVAKQDADALTNAGIPTFSGERALKIHQRLFDWKRHAVGSAENAEVRARLVELLQEDGWAVEQGVSSWSNVIARRPEQVQLTSRPLVLATHYDSCLNGPGAGDAGACVAAVAETGRLLSLQNDQWKRPIWLLFTDGEEAGLLGAKHFTENHPLSGQRPLVLNFDARGTAGPVLMYETHPGNSDAVSNWVNSIARPQITGSLFTAIYRLLPNGTDFTVFHQTGWQGFNFAIIDGAHRYHEQDDTFANLDPRSVQHFGEHALKLSTRIASDAEELSASTENAVFFDLLGLFVVHYPVWWCLPIRFAVLIISVQLYGRHVLRLNVLRQTAQVWLSMLLIMIAAPIAGWIVSSCIYRTLVLPQPFVWYGHWLSLVMWCLSLLMSLSIGHWMLRGIEQSLVWNAFWLGQATTCLVVSIYAPEFSYLFSVPAGIAIVLTLTVRSLPLRTFLATAAAGILLIPVQHLLSIALGPRMGILLVPAFALIAMPMLPALGKHSAVPAEPKGS
jgi:hypothetical protein